MSTKTSWYVGTIACKRGCNQIVCGVNSRAEATGGDGGHGAHSADVSRVGEVEMVLTVGWTAVSWHYSTAHCHWLAQHAQHRDQGDEQHLQQTRTAPRHSL